MASQNCGGEYVSENADELVGELFSGKLQVGEAIEKLRTRLLDLSARNGLLNYRHPRGKCLQFVKSGRLDLVFQRLLLDGRQVVIKYVPEPDPGSYEGKRPEARMHASRLGIPTTYEFEVDDVEGRRLQGLQALQYPAELSRQLRKLSGDAKTAIEETGSNMLFLVFGFLEFYDSDDSERPLLAPLLSLPIELVRDALDPETHTQLYAIRHNGEDVADNQTLREKLRRDFMLSLPDFDDEEGAESYLVKIEKAVRTKRRWKIRRQMTLAILSFGKLAIWADLDTKKNKALQEHELIQSIFGGKQSAGEAALFADDYKIDDLPEPQPPLVYDADSSQHSAIVDVLAGKNLVINGPPGTGKSQTITNVIAAALSEGKTVLFVSEKLAALEVVRHRLNQAGLGHFCLELHSHKTQKRQFLDDVQARIDQHFSAPAQYRDRLATLKRQKDQLARYAELMGSCFGNALGLTINEVFWALERRRQAFDRVMIGEVAKLYLPEAREWTLDRIEADKSRLAELAQLARAAGPFRPGHPWWGFKPGILTPADESAVLSVVQLAHHHAVTARDAALEVVQLFALDEQPDAKTAESWSALLRRIPAPSPAVDATLLPRIFNPQTDPIGKHSAQVLASLAADVKQARALLSQAADVLTDTLAAQVEAAALRSIVDRRLWHPALLAAQLSEVIAATEQLGAALERFNAAAHASDVQCNPLSSSTLLSFLRAARRHEFELLAPVPIDALEQRGLAALRSAEQLAQAFGKVDAVAKLHSISFDGTHVAVTRLVTAEVWSGLLPPQQLDERGLSELQRLAAHPLAQRSCFAIATLAESLNAACTTAGRLVERARQIAERLGISFSPTLAGLREVDVLVQVAVAAPQELLAYRRASLADASSAEYLRRIRASLQKVLQQAAQFEAQFYLDAIPGSAELKNAVRVLRRHDGLFAFFDGEWRAARKLHLSLCRNKRKLSARQAADELADLIAWQESRDSFIHDDVLIQHFGDMFRGLDTDHERIERLCAWYASSKAWLVTCPGLVGRVNLSTLPADRLAELAAEADRHRGDSELLEKTIIEIRTMLGSEVERFNSALEEDWDKALLFCTSLLAELRDVVTAFTKFASSDLLPCDALRMIRARADFNGVADALNLLQGGRILLADAADLRLVTLCDSTPWPQALEELQMRARAVIELAKDAFQYACPHQTLGTAVEFADAANVLLAVLEKLGVLDVLDNCSDWTEVVQAGYAVKNDLVRMHGIATPLLCRDSSINDFLNASDNAASGRAILDRLENSNEIRSVLGNVFKGEQTDLEAIAATHAWGSAVCSLSVPTPLRLRLLRADAGEVLAKARSTLANIVASSEAACTTISGLAAFGDFDWPAWQSGVSGRGELPREIESRLEEAVLAPPASVMKWGKYGQARGQLINGSLSFFVSALENEKISDEQLPHAFELAVYQSIAESIYRSFPELARFNGATHDQLRAEFRALDAELISLTGKACASEVCKRTRVPEGQRGATVGDYTEMQLLRREMNKQKRHIPIRQLVKRAGGALQALKPCFMMGPMSVAQYLEQGALRFDLVVMDEASQLRPEESLGAIARGSQLVVVGDPKQLPPSNFFNRMASSDEVEDEDEAPAATTGMESILDICQQLFTPIRSLRWHYRSQHESLIAFSNHHFYKNLVIFPSPYAKRASLGVKYRYIKSAVYQNKQNLHEAENVVDAVFQHMLQRPDESLGVVTLNQAQRDLVEELLHKKFEAFTEAGNFIERWEKQGWPFFVKNLENVQGDERDVILISTTFGKPSGAQRVRQNFGPISRDDGWRRLNVLFTRAKRRIELFTSMLPEDIIVDERTPAGTRALRDYLDFARRGILTSTDEGEREPDSDFEVAVANVVLSLGYEVKPQLGVAGFFIDMAVRNPDRPGEYLAAIECDGAAYHSGFSVRDRDRIRQDILESLGWRGRIFRIWSTDWFYNPAGEIARLRDFLQGRRAASAAEVVEQTESEEWTPVCSELLDDDSEVEISPTEEELAVEVGDRVCYCTDDMPSEHRWVQIVDSKSNARMGLINEHTPLAQALLGLVSGDVGKVQVPGQKDHHVRVITLQRQANLVTNS